MDDHIKAMREILDNGAVPQRVTNKMILSSIQAIWRRMGNQGDCLAEIQEDIRGLDNRVTTLEKDKEKNPSIIAYVKGKPIRAVGILVGFLFLLTLALSFSEPLRALVATLLP